MPELPEVETVRNELEPLVVGRRITGVTLLWERTARDPGPEQFRARLTGQEITGIRRRGKYLIFSLSGGEYLVVHLKMTGALLHMPDTPEPPKYVRAVIHLDDGTGIFFRDPRKFGRMLLVRDASHIEDALGPEPLGDGFTAGILADRLARRTAPIKAALIDQKVLAGVGNMYADEALYAAGINPWRPARSLSRDEIERLHQELRRILWEAIGHRGASVNTYFPPDGSEGLAHYQFKVAHGLGGKTCPACGGPIERAAIRNRGTYFCPHCQPTRLP